MSYKLTRKAQTDLSALVDFSLERFGTDTAVRHVDTQVRLRFVSSAALAHGVVHLRYAVEAG